MWWLASSTTAFYMHYTCNSSYLESSSQLSIMKFLILYRVLAFVGILAADFFYDAILKELPSSTVAIWGSVKSKFCVNRIRDFIRHVRVILCYKFVFLIDCWMLESWRWIIECSCNPKSVNFNIMALSLELCAWVVCPQLIV